MTVTNSTFSGNSTNADGGGIDTAASSIAIIINSTIVSNTAFEGGGVDNPAGTVDMFNTLLANNSATSGNDCSGSVTSSDYNLIEDTTACTASGATSHNIYGQDPLVGPLAANGGSTETHALLDGSPAIDNGSCSGAPSTDQRGVIRPQNFGCDIGSYEFDGVVVNDGRGSAEPVTSGQTITATSVTITDTNWYKINVPNAGSTVSITLNSPGD
jgi:hypothetical protein